MIIFSPVFGADKKIRQLVKQAEIASLIFSLKKFDFCALQQRGRITQTLFTPGLLIQLLTLAFE